MNRLLPALLLALAACRGTLSPLSNKVKVGEEPYFVFAADGEEGVGDLFASLPANGKAYRITFTRVDERLPALSPDGVMLAFDRGRLPGDTASRRVVVMNLLNGAEREVVPPGVLRPVAIAWSADGGRVVIRGASGVVVAVPAPPALGEASPADTGDLAALAVKVGGPVGAEAGPCSVGGGVCVRVPGGREVVLDSAAAEPAGWFGDSVAYRRGTEWVIHPLAGGRTRVLRWPEGVVSPRAITRFSGPR